MTYCVAIKLNAGLVFLSDSRTNAGLDQISTFRKMIVYEKPDDRFMVLLSAGNLSISQSVREILQVEQLKDTESGEPITIWNAKSMFDAARVLGAVFTLHVDWLEVARQIVDPQLPGGHDMLLMVVAVFGTTISPYLFFWQAGQEMEDVNAGVGLPHSRVQVRRHLRRIKMDTVIGMAFSNLIAFFIILSTAVTLHASGIKDIQTSAQAAEALRPLAGELTFLLFSLGIIGTGMLAVPVLAGSAAYAVAEVAGWRGSLSLRLDKGEGRGFYGVIMAATLGGVALCFMPIDPVRVLFWSAVLNGVIAVPIMAVMMLLASRASTMGEHVVGRALRWLGWGATGVMGATVIAMLLTT